MFLDRKDLISAAVVLFFVWIAHMVTPAHPADAPKSFPTHDATPYSKAVWAAWCTGYFAVESKKPGYEALRPLAHKSLRAAIDYVRRDAIHGLLAETDWEISQKLSDAAGRMESAHVITPAWEAELCVRFARKYKFRWENAFVPETSS